MRETNREAKVCAEWNAAKSDKVKRLMPLPILELNAFIGLNYC